MSIQHVAAVLYHMPELRRGPAAFALVAIADSADRESGWSWSITLAAIQRATRLSERTTQRALRELESAGYIRTERPLGGTPRYRVLFDFNGTRQSEAALYEPKPKTPPRQSDTPPQPRGRQPDTGGRHRDTGGRHNDTPNNESVSSPSFIQKTVLKNRGRGMKKIPPAPDSAAEREAIEQRRQATLRELERRAREKLAAECPVAPC